MDVNSNEVDKYGIIKGKILNKRMSKIIELVEKPKIKDAPSRLAIVGRYVLKNSIYEYLKKITKGKSNELQLTDAISLSAKYESVFSYKFSGTRYDCGSKLGYLKAQLASGLLDKEIRSSIKKELQNVTKKGMN